MEPALAAARTACAEQRWGDARRQFATLDADALTVDDLDLFATAAYLTGHDEEGFALWTRAEQRCRDTDSTERAVYFGARLGQTLAFKGDMPRCIGWIERTARLVDEAQLECVEQGYLEHGLAMKEIFGGGGPAAALARFERAVEIGTRFANRELVTLGRIGLARFSIYTGDVAAGVAMLDEAMVSIEAGELSVVSTGNAYCGVIDACAELSDIARCRTWTDSLLRWCDSQQELVLYRGHCFLHRAEVLAIEGRFVDALGEAQRACDRLAEPVPSAMAAGVALEGDCMRLIGDLDGAGAAYERAVALGAQTQPGLALLRLALDDVSGAHAMLARALVEAHGPIGRARLLPAGVEIALAGGDADEARAMADELRGLAHDLGSGLIVAHAAAAAGASALLGGDADAALIELRGAFNAFNQLDAHYDAARTRLRIAAVCRAMGDTASAEMEERIATTALASFGADAEGGPDRPDGLTRRELDVLLLLAVGKTNRVIGQELFISEKTVASHVSHIFTKLGVASRAAATAYAYDHGLA